MPPSEPPEHVPPSDAASGLRVAVVGHVDHGKSTLVGRLLADTGSLPAGKLDAVAAQCRRANQPFEYAFLVDALRDERAQNITIDAARIFFRSDKRAYQIIDAPGHVEFVRNMATGAARADAALLVLDAASGIQENTRRHARLLGVLGTPAVVVLVNKMDRVGWSEPAFRALAAEVEVMLAERGVRAADVVPVAAASGDNVVRRSREMPWYGGPTALDALERLEAPPADDGRAFRMPVQDVYRRAGHGGDRRILAGTVAAGSIRVGDEIVFSPSRKRTRVATIERFPDSLAEARAGDAIGLTLADELYVRRGELVARADESPPCVATRIRVVIFWLSHTPLVAGRSVVVQIGAARAGARVAAIESVVDADGDVVDPRRVAVDVNQIATCVLALDRPIACDAAPPGVAAAGPTSRLVIVDDQRIRGGGTIRGVLPRGDAPATIPARAPAPAPAGAVVWLTGLSGAGKSTIAAWVERELAAQGQRVERLDGDTIRGIFPDLGFSRAERDAHVRRVGHLASRLEHHGVIVLAAFISPYAESREFVRRLCRTFVEVHVSTPLAECERRDPKGLYAKARAGAIEHFTGVDDPFEPPARAELTLDTSAMTVEAAGTAILDHLAARLRSTRGSAR